MGRKNTTTPAEMTPVKALVLERTPSEDELSRTVARFVASFYPRSRATALVVDPGDGLPGVILPLNGVVVPTSVCLPDLHHAD